VTLLKANLKKQIRKIMKQILMDEIEKKKSIKKTMHNKTNRN
jgi:hypothetical protein